MSAAAAAKKAAAAAKSAAAATVKYIWRFPRPKKDRDARLVLFTAYEATIRVEKNPSKILLRADIHHGRKFYKGKYVPDAPHITASYQTPALEAENKYHTLHGADIHRGRKWHEDEGKYVPDAPHITASYQTPALEAEHKYHTLHGYVAGMQHYLLTRVQKGRTKRTMGDKGWPKGAEANRQTESHRGISWKVKQSRYDPPRITTSYQTPALEAIGQYRTLHGGQKPALKNNTRGSWGK
ncbi:hypothetical protein OCS_03160 [Ophiocordyceps sinensis CO18]|uniref:Uncharacterized protein n=1 Tax=Ophiocordyceps sinensis (strain Co18 / CGMCC 3.14243) TaxID=911162 RepID=T5AH42_OPHSC|nr:hypothetical protein OCS_03160 [Ophiocordyceps sinensis CO18]